MVFFLSLTQVIKGLGAAFSATQYVSNHDEGTPDVPIFISDCGRLRKKDMVKTAEEKRKENDPAAKAARQAKLAAEAEAAAAAATTAAPRAACPKCGGAASYVRRAEGLGVRMKCKDEQCKEAFWAPDNKPKTDKDGKDSKADAAAVPGKKAAAAAAAAAETPAERAERLAAEKAKRAEKQQEWLALKEAKRAKAAELGLSLEEYDAQRKAEKAQRDAAKAKELGLKPAKPPTAAELKAEAEKRAAAKAAKLAEKQGKKQRGGADDSDGDDSGDDDGADDNEEEAEARAAARRAKVLAKFTAANRARSLAGPHLKALALAAAASVAAANEVHHKRNKEKSDRRIAAKKAAHTEDKLHSRWENRDKAAGGAGTKEGIAPQDRRAAAGKSAYNHLPKSGAGREQSTQAASSADGGFAAAFQRHSAESGLDGQGFRAFMAPLTEEERAARAQRKEGAMRRLNKGVPLPSASTTAAPAAAPAAAAPSWKQQFAPRDYRERERGGDREHERPAFAKKPFNKDDSNNSKHNNTERRFNKDGHGARDRDSSATRPPRPAAPAPAPVAKAHVGRDDSGKKLRHRDLAADDLKKHQDDKAKTAEVYQERRDKRRADAINRKRTIEEGGDASAVGAGGDKRPRPAFTGKDKDGKTGVRASEGGVADKEVAQKIAVAAGTGSAAAAAWAKLTKNANRSAK